MANEPAKILLVDDDPAMLRLLAKWLDVEGYSVLRATDGRAAMEVIESEHPKILVTDWEIVRSSASLSYLSAARSRREAASSTWSGAE